MAQTKCGFDGAPQGASGQEMLVAWGPTLLVDVGFDPNFVPIVKGPPPVPGMRNLNALVDTGAQECCIDSRLAVQLGLPVVDRRQVSGIHGSHSADVHLAQV